MHLWGFEIIGMCWKSSQVFNDNNQMRTDPWGILSDPRMYNWRQLNLIVSNQ